MPEQTMSYLIKDFILHLRATGRATSTIACYHIDFFRLSLIFGNIHPQCISDKDIDLAIVRIAAAKRSGARKSSATMNRIKSTYQTFFKWAFDSKWMPSNQQNICVGQKRIRGLLRR